MNTLFALGQTVITHTALDALTKRDLAAITPTSSPATSLETGVILIPKTGHKTTSPSNGAAAAQRLRDS